MPIWRKEHELARVVVHYIGIIICAVAVTVITGRIGHNVVLAGWGDQVPMSFPTAGCLALAGIGFYLVSRGEASNASGRG